MNKVAFWFLLAFSCGCQMSQGSRQLSDDAFITFLGATSGQTFRVDDSEEMAITRLNARFRIESGPHVILVFEDGKLVHQQKVYAGSGQIVEVRIR